MREEVNSYYDINVDDNHFYNEHSRLPMLSKAYSDQFHSDLLSEVDSMSR